MVSESKKHIAGRVKKYFNHKKELCGWDFFVIIIKIKDIFEFFVVNLYKDGQKLSGVLRDRIISGDGLYVERIKKYIGLS